VVNGTIRGRSEANTLRRFRCARCGLEVLARAVEAGHRCGLRWQRLVRVDDEEAETDATA